MVIKFNYRKEVDPELKFAEANRRLNANDNLGEVIDMLYSISKEYPDFGKVYNHLGWIYENKFRDFVKAEENYKLALELSPDYPAVYENYAFLLEKIGKYEDLENLLAKAYEQPSTNKEAVNRQSARLYELKSDFDKAISHYKQAIMHNFSNDEIVELEASIKRCEKKKEILRLDVKQ